MHKLFVRLLLIVALLPSLFAEAEPATVTVGMPLADLMKLKAMPQTRAALGKK